MYFEKSMISAAQVACPPSAVPPPRARIGTLLARARVTVDDVLLVTRSHHADGDLAIVGSVMRIDSNGATVEADFTFDRHHEFF